MFAHKRALGAVLVLVFLIALAVYAQEQPRQRTPRTAPGSEQRAARPERPDVMGGRELPTLDTGDRTETFYRFVNVQRYLLPPNARELAMIATAVGLTEQQRQSIMDLYTQFRNNVKPITDERAAATKELITLMQQPAPNKAALQAAYAKIARADAAILDAEFDFWLAFKRVLNAQQAQALNTMLQQRVEMQAGPAAGGRTVAPRTTTPAPAPAPAPR